MSQDRKHFITSLRKNHHLPSDYSCQDPDTFRDALEIPESLTYNIANENIETEDDLSSKRNRVKK